MNTQTSIEDFITVDLVRASYRSDDFPSEIADEERRGSLRRYEMFLELCRRFPTERIAPTRDIDRFWHLHMLSPVAYHRDCMRAFGRLLDHDGGFGKSADEEEALERTFKRTAELWEATFGVPYLADGTWIADVGQTNCWHDCSGRCWHACSSLEAAGA